MPNTSDVPQKNAAVSIILSESTASLLKLNVPRLENSLEDSETSLCSIKAIKEAEVDSNLKQVKLTLKDFIFNTANGRSNIDSDKVTTELAYLSNSSISSNSSIGIVDDLSEENVERSEEELKLDLVKIYIRPLCSANTEAHRNNIFVKNNSLYVAIKDSDLSITSLGWINICRICHGGESTGNLLAPCRCRGSIALAHRECLEHWLKESSSSRCELCNHHFELVREPKYSVPWSIIMFLRHPGDHCKELILDLLAFLVYTPSAFASTYMLMLLCESIAKSNLYYNRALSAHIMAFSAIFGIAAIDFTYSTWLIVTLQKHADAWKSWYRNNCKVKLLLPQWKQKRFKKRLKRKIWEIANKTN